MVITYFSGVVLGKPWTWIENASDPIDPKLIDPQHKNLGLVGYCIDLVKEFSERIGFDYELVISDGLGKKDKDTGMWTGKRVCKSNMLAGHWVYRDFESFRGQVA